MSKALALGLMLLIAAPATAADTPAGRWDAIVVIADGTPIPFRFEIDGNGDDVKGVFFDGDKKITSKRGTFKDGALSLPFDQYATTLRATLKDGQLEGTYLRGSRPAYKFQATRHVDAPRAAGAAANVPSIAGAWKVTG